MSYCRWSSDDYKSDVYSYEHCAGYYATHVASNRLVAPLPEVDMSLLVGENANPDEWTRQYKAQHEEFERIGREPIGLPYDGETFEDRTLGEFLNTLLMLRGVGYHVPEYALDRVREEIAELGENHEPSVDDDL